MLLKQILLRVLSLELGEIRPAQIRPISDLRIGDITDKGTVRSDRREQASVIYG